MYHEIPDTKCPRYKICAYLLVAFFQLISRIFVTKIDRRLRIDAPLSREAPEHWATGDIKGGTTEDLRVAERE